MANGVNMFKGTISSDIFGEHNVGTYVINDDATISFVIDAPNHKGAFTDFTPNAFLAFLEYYDYFRSWTVEEA